MDKEIKKKLASNWFKLLQNTICNDIEKLEGKKFKFKSKTWNRNEIKDEGGGEFRILKNGKIFEKVGVNFSEIQGKFSKEMSKKIPGASKDPNFWASGISIVMHMRNPHIPAIHFNTRFIYTTHGWFGGGMDVKMIKFYQSSDDFFKSKKGQRVILLTTKSVESYENFKFKNNDTLLFGRESAGVPRDVHNSIKHRLKIPMMDNKRSLNIASSVAIVLSENLRQTNFNK